MYKRLIYLIPFWVIPYYLWTTIPTRAMSIVWFGTLYLLAYLFLALKGKRILFALSRDPIIFALIGLSGMSYFWSVAPDITFASTRSLIVQYVIVGYLATTYSLRQIIGFLSKIFCATGVLSLLYVLFLPHIAVRRGGLGGTAWQGIFPHQSVLAATMALALISVVSVLIMEPAKREQKPLLFALGMIGICAYLLLFCGAKTAIIGCIASFAILPFFFLKKIKGIGSRNLIFLTLAAIFCIGIPLLYFAKDIIIVELLGKNPTLSGRSYLWEYMMGQVWAQPFGYGLDAYWHNSDLVRAVYATLRYPYGNSHSNYVDMLLGIGVPGLILVGLFIINLVRKSLILAFTHRRMEYVWVLQIIVFISIAAYSDSFMGYLRPRTIGWVLLSFSSLSASLELGRLKRDRHQLYRNPLAKSYRRLSPHS